MLECKGKEALIGIEVFYSDSEGIGGRLKRSPEDFLVNEVSTYPERMEGGSFTIAKVTAQNWEMNRLVRQLSKALGISREKIGFAGTKDKRAITSQLMSFEAPMDEVMGLNIHQVRISDAYTAKKNITIGSLIGNQFIVKVTGTSLKGAELQASIDHTALILGQLKGFPNFFGVQRFGALRPVTQEVGKCIIKGDLEKAVLTYCGNPMPEEADDVRNARSMLDETHDFQRAMTELPRTLTFERIICGYLARNPGDYRGGIMVLPPNLQMMFVHAYQSLIFNRVLSERIRRGIPLDRAILGDLVLPIDRQGLPDHDHSVLVTKSNQDMVDKQLRNGRACVSGTLFGSESKLTEGEMGEMEREPY